MNEENMMNGNAALQPQYKPYKKHDKRIHKNKNENKQKKIKKKLRVLLNICVFFVIGLILIYRYSIIYNMQTDLNSAENNVDNISRQNENLTVELVKYNNLKYIEDDAVNKLKMVVPNKQNAVYIDLDKPVIKTQEDEDSMKTQKGMLNKLKQLIWR
ncbi:MULTISPECIES: cell division protein FtsL [Clostridium]|jgi:cell division protein FtsL|uniref:Cell division protein FtsL n=1 Tax=Clostridium lapidicellarium TaxID=3240931 RepID=A0ABV4DSV7_9CLOT|nr:cell division protein FtsL [uncultured Clostridium sp.]